MQVQGIDLSTLTEQFQYVNQGSVLLYDGDFSVYRASATVKTLKTAIRRFYQEVLTEMFLTGTKECRVFITPSGNAKCNRYWYPSVKRYQDNRKNKVEIPLREPLKQHLISNPTEYHSEGISIVYDYWHEADDLIVQDSYSLENCIVSSGDKDLRLSPASRWDAKTGSVQPKLKDRFGYITLDRTEASPVKGHGTKFFWWQMLAGDTADNVKGILKLHGKNCGDIGAYEALQDFTDETECAEWVIQQYANIQQDVLAEAEMMWLRRTPDDSACKYILEVIKDPILREWIQGLGEYHKKYVQHQIQTTQEFKDE